MGKETKEIKIPCSKLLKDYNTKYLKSIADMSINDVYISISASGGIITKKSATCNNLLEKLIKKIYSFKPSSPMTAIDQVKLADLHKLWIEHLRGLITAVKTPVKPTYLRDMVTEELKKRDYNEECSNIHLEWYLEQHPNSILEPGKIADAIIEYAGCNWAEVKHLKRDAVYYVTSTTSECQTEVNGGSSPKKCSRTKGKYDYILDTIEFIHSFPSTPGIDTLDSRIKNDIKVADEVLEWRRKDTDTYDYKVQFQSFLNRLETLPDKAREITFAEIEENTPKTVKSKKKAIPMKDEVAASAVSSNTPEESTGHSPQSQEKPAQENLADIDEKQTCKPDSFTDDVIEATQEDSYKENYSKLMEFLTDKARTVSYLKSNIGEEYNKKCIEKFAHRQDFNEVFETLQSNSSDMEIKASLIMQYIRNVVLYDIQEWGKSAPSRS